MQGSVIGPQQHYLERMEGPMHREGLAFRQRVRATVVRGEVGSGGYSRTRMAAGFVRVGNPRSRHA